MSPKTQCAIRHFLFLPLFQSGSRTRETDLQQRISSSCFLPGGGACEHVMSALDASTSCQQLPEGVQCRLQPHAIPLRLVRLAQKHGAARRTRGRTHGMLKSFQAANSTMLQVALESLSPEMYSQLRLNCYHRNVIFFLLTVLVYALLRRPPPQRPSLRPHS